MYQVGPGGVPTVANASSLVFTILPGFSQTSAKSGQDSSGNSQTVYYPFGMWFANTTTLYVADEGQVSTDSTSPALVYDSVNQVYNNALPANNPTAGLQKWTFDGTKWNLIYTLQAGLNLGVPYSVPNDTSGNVYPTGINPATGLPWTPSNNGLRNITGQVNGDGTVTIYGITSTASGATDQGGDPNQLVTITDTLAATSPTAGEAFTTLRIATYGEVLRGVALAPGANVNIAASASPAGGGATSGGGSVAIGTPVTLTATANAGYSFVNWTENGTPVSTAASFNFTATQDRTLVANLASGNANLASLAPSSGTLSPNLDPSVLNYTDTVAYAVFSLTITPTVADSTATVTVNGTAVVSGSASTPIALNVGANSITTIVTAQDGTTKTYTLAVTRGVASTDANLLVLDSSAGTFAPAFDCETSAYSQGVPNTTTSVSVTPTVEDSTATVTVNGTAVTSGSASAPIALHVGLNTITTVVTAQDGTTTKTYTLTVARAASADANLASLVPSVGTLDQTFASIMTSYTETVDYTTSTLTVTPTVEDSTATVTVNGAAVPSGTASAPITLSPGDNVITLLVTAQDGTTQTYTLTVTQSPATDVAASDVPLFGPTGIGTMGLLLALSGVFFRRKARVA